MEEIEKSLRVSFCGAANSVSQLYVQSLHLQKQSYISGYQKAVEQMMQFAASKAYKANDSKIVIPLEELMLFCNRQLQSLQVESGPQQNQVPSLQSPPPSTPSIPLQNPENTEMSQTHRQISELNQPSLYSESSQNEHQHQQQQQHYANNQQQQQMVNQQDFISSNSSGNQNFSTDFKEGGRKRPIGFTFEPPSSLLQNGLYNTGTPSTEQQQQQTFPFFYQSEQVAKRGRFELPISQQ